MRACHHHFLHRHHWHTSPSATRRRCYPTHYRWSCRYRYSLSASLPLEMNIFFFPSSSTIAKSSSSDSIASEPCCPSSSISTLDFSMQCYRLSTCLCPYPHRIQRHSGSQQRALFSQVSFRFLLLSLAITLYRQFGIFLVHWECIVLALRVWFLLLLFSGTSSSSAGCAFSRLLRLLFAGTLLSSSSADRAFSLLLRLLFAGTLLLSSSAGCAVSLLLRLLFAGTLLSLFFAGTLLRYYPRLPAVLSPSPLASLRRHFAIVLVRWLCFLQTLATTLSRHFAIVLVRRLSCLLFLATTLRRQFTITSIRCSFFLTLAAFYRHTFISHCCRFLRRAGRKMSRIYSFGMNALWNI